MGLQGTFLAKQAARFGDIVAVCDADLVQAEQLKEKLGGKDIQIEVDSEGQIVAVVDQDGQPVAHIFAYWFAWQAFHPETGVYTLTN